MCHTVYPQPNIYPESIGILTTLKCEKCGMYFQSQTWDQKECYSCLVETPYTSPEEKYFGSSKTVRELEDKIALMEDVMVDQERDLIKAEKRIDQLLQLLWQHVEPQLELPLDLQQS